MELFQPLANCNVGLVVQALNVSTLPVMGHVPNVRQDSTKRQQYRILQQYQAHFMTAFLSRMLLIGSRNHVLHALKTHTEIAKAGQKLVPAQSVPSDQTHEV